MRETRVFTRTSEQSKCDLNALPACGPDMRTIASLALVVLAVAQPLSGQAPPPLDKTELIRLLTNPLFAQTEVADVVRRSCLTFHPTERDWADLRNAGAGGEVIASAAGCDNRRSSGGGGSAATAAAAEAPQPITAVAQPSEIVTT